ncbi:MAG: 2-oxo acid dehydrogenase subunit E2 [Dehalococcoidia bacterium]|nr:2-oxo acid dehydrogenase subunit E2 [Dehalococcoidia bacterium]
MAVEVVVPSFGLGWNSGRLVEWCRADGATVHRGDPVALVESDHALLELEAESDGVLRYRDGGNGDGIVPPGAVLALILAPGERLPADDAPAAHHEDAPHHEPAPELDDERRPPILPLRRHTLPEVEEAPAGGTWDRIPGDDVEVGDEWIAEELPEAPAPAWDEPAFEAASDPEAPEAAETPATMLFDPPAAEDMSWEQRFNDRFGEPEPTLEPPVKDPSDDPRDYFDVAPFAEGITVMEVEPEPAFEPQPEPEFTFEPEPVAFAEPCAADEPAPAPAAATPGALHMRVTVDLREVRKMRSQLAREWHGNGPADEDVVVRALGRALEELRMDVPGRAVAVVVPARDGDLREVVRDASRRPFRDAVDARAAAGDSDDDPVATVVSFAAAGVEDGVPEIPAGNPFVLALGAAREWALFEGDRVVPVPVASLTLAYDPRHFPAGEAAWLAGRVRELLEAPYALLAA